MKRIRITRGGDGTVSFETVSVDTSETVFFLNLDERAEHWPTIAANRLGAAPSAPSSQCDPVPYYGCRIPGHESESGTIHISRPLAGVNLNLAAAIRGQAIARQLVVRGGLPPYRISGRLFEVIGPDGAVIDSGAGIGPGLELIPRTDNTGVEVSGIPTLAGTYKFTFTVDDAIGGNLQQGQYTMVVA